MQAQVCKHATCWQLLHAQIAPKYKIYLEEKAAVCLYRISYEYKSKMWIWKC